MSKFSLWMNDNMMDLISKESLLMDMKRNCPKSKGIANRIKNIGIRRKYLCLNAKKIEDRRIDLYEKWDDAEGVENMLNTIKLDFWYGNVSSRDFQFFYKEFFSCVIYIQNCIHRMQLREVKSIEMSYGISKNEHNDELSHTIKLFQCRNYSWYGEYFGNTFTKECLMIMNVYRMTSLIEIRSAIDKMLFHRNGNNIVIE